MRKKRGGEVSPSTKTALFALAWSIFVYLAIDIETHPTRRGMELVHGGPQQAVRGLRSIATWNPCSQRQVDREQDPQQAPKDLDVVLLIGTRCKVESEPVEQIRQGAHRWASRAGWQRSPNKATGKEMWFNSKVLMKKHPRFKVVPSKLV